MVLPLSNPSEKRCLVAAGQCNVAMLVDEGKRRGRDYIVPAGPAS